MKKFLVLALVSVGMLQASAQISMPQPSPLSTITQKVGLTDVTVTYSRPSAKARKVFGDLVPFDKLWRTGANMATKLTVTDTVMVGGVKFPKGDYSIFSIPGAAEWTIIINKNANLGGVSGYKESEDVVRVKVKPSVVPYTESFTIGFGDLTSNSANIELSWETTKVSFKVETDVDGKVMKNIDNALNVSAATYFQAARYYFETNRDLKQALIWIDQSIKLEERYWVLRQKSLIQAKLGDFKGAIETATRSLELSKEAKNDDYVKMNTESIADWKKKQ